MNSKVYRAMLSAQIRPNATKFMARGFTVQINTAQKIGLKKHISFQGKELGFLSKSESSRATFYSLKTKLRANIPTNKKKKRKLWH